MRKFVLLFSALALSGCVYVQNSHVRHHGNDVSKQQVALIEPGKTDKSWVLQNLGTPDRIQSDVSGVEVYEYLSERTRRSEKRFILLFSVESDKVLSRKITRVVLKDV
jgi:outer membrane protein assembly factor BamE (lipoprotein component of BamABCDE complex)